MSYQTFHNIQTALAGTLKDLGESMTQEIKQHLATVRDMLSNRGVENINPLFVCIATAAEWGADAKKTAQFTGAAYDVLATNITAKRAILDHLMLDGGSGRNLIVSYNLLHLWQQILNNARNLNLETMDWVEFQSIVEKEAGTSKHWMAHAPFKVGVIDGLIPPDDEIKIPIGNMVLKGLEKMGLLIRKPLTIRTINLIQDFALFWARLGNTNHFIIDSGCWKLGKETP